MGDGRYQALSGRGALLPDAISTACSNIRNKALPDAGMEQAGVSARACVPELLAVPSQGIKLDIPRRHRTAQRSPSSAAASRRTAVKRSLLAVSFCSETRSTVRKATPKTRGPSEEERGPTEEGPQPPRGAARGPTEEAAAPRRHAAPRAGPTEEGGSCRASSNAENADACRTIMTVTGHGMQERFV